MTRTVQITADGSATISIPEMQVTYRSIHGALQESLHVYIHAGLVRSLEIFEGPVNIFEMGFGTGLNAILTYQHSMQTGRKIYYYAVEQFPLLKDEYALLDYGNKSLFMQLHESGWGEDLAVSESFTLHKAHTSLQQLSTGPQFHLVYYDAFAPRAQPELWTAEIFRKIYGLLLPGGVLVTYCSKADVRRALTAAGFVVQKIQGPRGKREMLRAGKPLTQG